MSQNPTMHTTSLCPICLRKLEAYMYEEDKSTYMKKECPEHGEFKTLVWRDTGTSMQEWIRTKERAHIKNPITKVEKGCPYDCGLCSAHRQHTCTALLEVTKRCNLHCQFCFADALGQTQDPTLEQIRFQFETIFRVSGKCNIQLSGGEPTMRDDLPKIVALAASFGFPFIQVNTNGIRLAQDERYLKSLKEAGLHSVFLQFDGTDDKIYKALRGKALFELKKEAILNCQKYGIGVVLVPTLVPKINIDNIGDIVRFGMQHSPTVRGVHFQPVSYFGRIPKEPSHEDRITLPEVMHHIYEQTDKMVSLESMQPPGCENSLCSFNGNYLVEDGVLKPISKRSCCTSQLSSATEGANKAKAFVARNWSYQKQVQEEKLSDWDKILESIQNRTFCLSGMAFQDVWNVNLERIRDCCIHVSTLDGRLIPFCMYNLTNKDGVSLYRDNVAER